MAAEYLHMDNTIHFREMLWRYGWKADGERAKNSGFFKSEILCRIFVVVQTTFIMVFGTARQAIRAVTFTVTGILTFNCEHLKFALKDYLSIVVQAVALPILCIVAIFTPAHASLLATKLLGRSLDSIGKTRVNLLDIYEDDRPLHTVFPTILVAQPLVAQHGFVAKTILRITGSIQSIMIVAQGALRALFTFEFACMTLTIPLMLLYAPYNALITYWGHPTATMEAHGFYHKVQENG